VIEPPGRGSDLLEIERVGNGHDMQRTWWDPVLPPTIVEQRELRRDHVGQIRFHVADRAALREIEPSKGIPARKLHDLRTAGLADQLADALVTCLEHRSVEGELVALEPVLSQDLLERVVGTDAPRHFPRKRDVRELAIVSRDLGGHADAGQVGRHAASLLVDPHRRFNGTCQLPPESIVLE
jgi:hypothetical protein